MSDVEGLLSKIASNGDFASAAEWAALSLTGFPTNRTAALKHVANSGWQSLGLEKARKRAGRGGGWEYHVSCLPEAAQADYARRKRAADGLNEVARQEQVVAASAEIVPQTVDARRRLIMESRAAVILELERRAVLCGSFSKAVSDFLSEAKAGLLQEPHASTVKRAMDKGRGLTPSRPTLYNWRKAWAESGGDPMALIPEKRVQETKKSVDAIYPWFPAFLRHYAKPQRPTIHHAVNMMLQDMTTEQANRWAGHEPSYQKARRALKALTGSADNLLKHKGREGPLALKARMAYVSRSLEGLEPGTIYTGDGKTFDAEVRHPRHGRPFRPEITTIVDVATRKAVGWSVGLAENAEVVTSAILHAVQSNGIPAIFYADRGSGYKNARVSTSTHGLCARLGISTTHSLPYNSQARGVIERVHGTIWNRLAKDYPSYMGKDMDPEAAKKVFRESRRSLQIIEGKRQVEDPKTLQKAQETYARLIISWPQFLEDVEAAIDEYNDTPHSGMRIRDPESGRMRSASPNEVWAQFEATGFQAFHLEPGEADDLYRPYERRKTSRALVELHTNSYFSLDLEPWHGEYVFVGYDIHDGQRVWVRQIDMVDGEEAPGPLICVAEFAGNEQRYVPVSAQQLAEEKRRKGRLQRVQNKVDEIEAEARPQLEHQQVVQLEMPAVRQPAHVPAEVMDAEVLSFQPGPGTPAQHPDCRNPYEDPDIDLAWSIVDAPAGTEIPHGHVRLMTGLLRNRAALDMMREVGLPLTELADRVAAAQAPLKSSNGR